MSDPKKPFHVVLSQRLLLAPIGMGPAGASISKAAEVATLLAVLGDSEMPVEAAHQIAMLHSGLPEAMRVLGQPLLAEIAEKVLDDLLGRGAQEKPAEETGGRRNNSMVDRHLTP